MPCRLTFSSVAFRQVHHLDPAIRDRVERALAVIAEDPSAGKPLRGPLHSKFSYRVGDWRIVYLIDGEVIYVEAIAHRSTAYR